MAVLAGSRLPQRIRRRAAAFPFRDAALHSCLAFFFLLFLTQLDKQLVAREWLPLPGVVLFAACVGAFVVCLLASGTRSPADLWGHGRAMLRRHWPFALAFATLVALSWANWFRSPDPSLANALSLALPFAICATAALLPLSSRVRLHWRTYLWIAFAGFCLSVWVEAFGQGVFTMYGHRLTGLAPDPNEASHLVLLLASPLIARRRPGIGALAALLLAGATVFLTQSRGGLALFVLLALGALAFGVWQSPGRRPRFLLAFAVTGTLTAFACWASVQTLPYFRGLERAWLGASGSAVVRKVDVFLDVPGWLTVQWDIREDEARIAAFRERVRGFGRINAAETAALGRTQSGTIEFDDPRIIRLRNAWEAVEASPLTGHGTGFSVWKGIHPDMEYLRLWIDHGAPGILVFMAMLAAGFWTFARLRFWPGAFVIGFLACWSLHSQTVIETRPLFVLLGILLALPLAVGRARETGAHEAA